MCFSLIKPGLAFAPPLRFAGLRALIGGLALLGWAVARREHVIPPGRGLWNVAVLSLPATTITFGAMFLSAGRMGAGIASILSERWTGRTVTALVLGLAGVSLIA